MNNEENKGFNRFQFSTDFDFGEKKDEEVVSEKKEVTLEEKQKTTKKKNRKPSPRKKKPVKKNNKSQQPPAKKEKDTVIPYVAIKVDSDKMEDMPYLNGEPVMPYIEAGEDSIIPYLEEDVPYIEVHSTKKGEVPKEKVEVEQLEEDIVDFPILPEEEDSAEEIVDEVPMEEEKPVVEEEKDATVEDTISHEVEEEVPDTVPETNPYDAELSSLEERGVKLNEARDIDLDHTLYREEYFVQNGEAEDQVVEEVKNVENESTDTTHTIRKVYLSFQARIILLVIGIVLLFGTACFIIFSTLQSNVAKKVNFIEKSTIHYEVCSKTNSTCETEGKSYVSNDTASVHVDYHYDALFDEEIDYNLSYHVVLTHKVYDRYDPKKVFYEDEDLIKDKTDLQKGANPATADVSVEINYQKYLSFVTDYQQKYSNNAISTVTAVLYVDDGNDTRNVGEVIIPMGDSSFTITRNAVKDSKQEYILDEKDWTNTNTLYIVVGSVLVLLSLFLLFHLTKLALAITGKKSKYQELLMSILNEYDRLIVIARDGYESTEEKKVIKVYTFDELLDIRGILNKPIIYSRINNVKSEFIVEDEESIYKYVLKEADMGE